MDTKFKIGDIVVDDYRCPGKVLEIVEIRNDSPLPIRAQEIDFNRVWNYTSDGAGVVGGLPILRLESDFPKNCDLLEELEFLLDELEYINSKVVKLQSKVDKSIEGLESTVLACTAAVLITIIFFQVVSYFN